MQTSKRQLPPSQTFPRGLRAEEHELAPLQLHTRLDGPESLRIPAIGIHPERESSPAPLTRRIRTEGAAGITLPPPSPHTPKPSMRASVSRRFHPDKLFPGLRFRQSSPPSTVAPDDSVSQVAENGKRRTHRKTGSAATSLGSKAVKHPNDSLRYHPSMLHDEYHSILYAMRRFGLKAHPLPEAPIDEGETPYEKSKGVYGATAGENQSDVSSFLLGDYIMEDESPRNVLGRRAPRFEWFKAKGQRCMKPYGAVVQMAGLAGKLDVVEKYGDSVMESDLEDVPDGWDYTLDCLGEVWLDDKGVGRVAMVLREYEHGLHTVGHAHRYDI
jgi:hypothetical protein